MRDKRCNRKLLEEEIIYEHGKINSKFEFIKETEEELGREFNSYVTSGDIIRRELNVIRYKYSLGFDLKELHKEYLVIVEQIRRLDRVLIEYEATTVVALGILFEDGIERFQHLINLMDEEKNNDLLFDYLINGCGFRRKNYSKRFSRKLLEFSTELIKLAQKDREQASKKLVYYMKKVFPVKFFGKNCETIDFDKFRGEWMYGYAAIAKMFKLDDSELKDNPHYPYELAHYKNEMEFTPEKMLDFPEENYKKGIPEYKVLEKIIPVNFHEVTNNLFVDFKTLSDEEFYEKYEIYQWIDLEFEEYVEQKNNSEVLGGILIYLLSKEGYIYAFDKFGEFEGIDNYKKFWGRRKVKPVCFWIDGDCNYYVAFIPKSSKIKSVLNIEIIDVEDIEELNEYEEYFGQFDE